MDDLISRQAILKQIEKTRQDALLMDDIHRANIVMTGMHLCDEAVRNQPSAQPEPCEDAVSRKAVYDAMVEKGQRSRRYKLGEIWELNGTEIREALDTVPSAEPEKEKAKRVLWTGWKGCRDTRYKCPNCKKPVKNDDIYCHRCGQKLMFPHISFTDYVPGEKQETIVRWDDE